MCVIALAIGDSVREPRRNLSQEPESSLIGMNYHFVLIFADFKREEMRCHGIFSGLTAKLISGGPSALCHRWILSAV
jgi:hypothetical protein